MAKTHVKPIQINWEEFDKLVSYQCTQEEIAAFFNTSVDTLERACVRDLGVTLAEIWDKRKLTGRVRLRKAQFAIVEAMGSGAATMAIYLDKKMFPNERPDLPPPPLPPETSRIMEPLLSFKDFCIKAGYFEPFEKQEEMRAFCIDNVEVRLLLGARGYGKTDFCTIMGVAYDLYKAWKCGKDMSEYTNLIITKSDKRCRAIVYEISSALKKNGVPLAKNNASEIRIEGLIGQDHSVEAITIKTSMRGRHPKRTVMDDPVTDEDTSEAMRKTVKKRYDEAYKLCPNIVIIGQPAHYDDLYANLRGIIKTLEVPWGSIPQLDADLEAMIKANIDRNSIEMSYHLRVPKDGTSIFSNLKFIDAYPQGQSVAFIDPSDGGDYTAVTIMRGYFDGVAVIGYAWKKAWYHCVDEIYGIFEKHSVVRAWFETNKHGKQPVEQLQVLLKALQVGVVGVHSDSDKHACIESAGSYAHMIHLSKESMSDYTNQVTKYEYGSKFDDAPDSLARGLIALGLIRAKK